MLRIALRRSITPSFSGLIHSQSNKRLKKIMIKIIIEEIERKKNETVNVEVFRQKAK